jgi:hypothetical protein
MIRPPMRKARAVSFDLPGEHDRLTELAFFGGHRPNRTRLRGFGLGLPLTARKQQSERR